MSTPPTGPRPHPSGPDTRRESTERRILESAQALIDAGMSWHQVGIRQITERAAISRTAFYDFFSSKNEVLEHLIRGLHEDLIITLRDTLDPSANGLWDFAALPRTLANLGAFAHRHGNAYRAFLASTSDDEHLAALWHELIDVYTALTAASINAVRERNPDAPSRIAAGALARTLLLMTERSLAADAALAQDPATTDALTFVWEHAVYGGAPPSAR